MKNFSTWRDIALLGFEEKNGHASSKKVSVEIKRYARVAKIIVMMNRRYRPYASVICMV